MSHLITSSAVSPYGLFVDLDKYRSPHRPHQRETAAELAAMGRHLTISTFLDANPRCAKLFMNGKISYRAVLAMANPRDNALRRNPDE